MPVPVKKKKKSAKRVRAGRRSQRKGKQYQKVIADIVSEHLGIPPEEFYSALAGLTGPDVAASRVARRLFPFAVETKDCKSVSMPQWLAEAEANADGAELPFALIFKLHGRRRNYITLELEEFLKWVK